jgi:hypothetical protein
MHASSFQNVSPMDASSQKLFNLRATVRGVHLNKAAYDLSGFGSDDLSKLFKEEAIPRFDIEVDSPLIHILGPPGPPTHH